MQDVVYPVAVIYPIDLTDKRRRSIRELRVYATANALHTSGVNETHFRTYSGAMLFDASGAAWQVTDVVLDRPRPVWGLLIEWIRPVLTYRRQWMLEPAPSPPLADIKALFVRVIERGDHNWSDYRLAFRKDGPPIGVVQQIDRLRRAIEAADDMTGVMAVLAGPRPQPGEDDLAIELPARLGDGEFEVRDEPFAFPVLTILSTRSSESSPWCNELAIELDAGSIRECSAHERERTRPDGAIFIDASGEAWCSLDAVYEPLAPSVAARIDKALLGWEACTRRWVLQRMGPLSLDEIKHLVRRTLERNSTGWYDEELAAGEDGPPISETLQIQYQLRRIEAADDVQGLIDALRQGYPERADFVREARATQD